MTTTARLALSDGTIFHGRAFGAANGSNTASGEVVFNTAMAGYQEALTDPSYAGQILTMTAPQIGNTGANAIDLESERVHATAFVVRELSRRHSNYRADMSLDTFLATHGVLGISSIDTRALTRRLRSSGVMSGVVSDDATLSDADLIELARAAPTMAGRELVSAVGRRGGGAWTETLGEWGPPASGPAASGPAAAAPAAGELAGPTILAIDCGAKSNILRHLVTRGCRVELVPFDVAAEVVVDRARSGSAHGLFVSNGPGDPESVSATVEALRTVIEAVPGDFPIFGICLGHQLLARAMGARTFKLPFGHRGANHPVLDVAAGRVQVTSQNHGFAVDAESLESLPVRVTHIHLNDGTVAGMEHVERPIFAVQHHPEASPGPHDASVLFDRFVESARAFGARSA